GEHLAVGEARVVVDGRVYVRVADAAVPAVSVLSPTEHSPATTTGYPPKLLDVHMQEVARALVLVAADHLAGRTVEPAEVAQAEPTEDRVDGGGDHPEAVRNPERAEFLPPPEALHPPLDAQGCAPGTTVRA